MIYIDKNGKEYKEAFIFTIHAMHLKVSQES